MRSKVLSLGIVVGAIAVAVLMPHWREMASDAAGYRPPVPIPAPYTFDGQRIVLR